MYQLLFSFAGILPYLLCIVAAYFGARWSWTAGEIVFSREKGLSKRKLAASVGLILSVILFVIFAGLFISGLFVPAIQNAVQPVAPALSASVSPQAPAFAVSDIDEALDSRNVDNSLALQATQRQASQLNLPVGAVQRNYNMLSQKQRFTQDYVDRLQKEYPTTAQWLKDPNNAAIAHGDMPPLREHNQSVVALLVALSAVTGLTCLVWRLSRKLKNDPVLRSRYKAPALWALAIGLFFFGCLSFFIGMIIAQRHNEIAAGFLLAWGATLLLCCCLVFRRLIANKPDRTTL